MSAKAECTWGDGPDVMVIISKKNKSGFDLVELNQYANPEDKASFGLTAKEALELAQGLIRSATHAIDLTADYQNDQFNEYIKNITERM